MADLTKEYIDIKNKRHKVEYQTLLPDDPKNTDQIMEECKSVERINSISCEIQIEYCKSSIKPEERGEKIITIIDNGFSGGNVNRDGFQKMMKLVRQNKVGKIVVCK